MKPSWSQLLLIILCLSTVSLSACTHKYIVAPDRVPAVQRNKVSLKNSPEEPPREYALQQIYLGRSIPTGELLLLIPPPDEVAAILRGEEPANTNGVVLEVSTWSEIWSDYTVPGTLYGMLTGAILTTAVFIANGQPIDNERLSIGVVATAYLGLQGALWSTIWGLIATSGTTDMRLDP